MMSSVPVTAQLTHNIPRPRPQPRRAQKRKRKYTSKSMHTSNGLVVEGVVVVVVGIVDVVAVVVPGDNSLMARKRT
jgi:hypothetical protein